MKRIVISMLLALLLTGMCFSLGQAQDAPEAPKDIFFGGVAYDDGFSLQGGYGGPVFPNVIAGGDLYAWFVLEMGLSPTTGDDSLFNAGSGGFEASLLFGDEKFFYGLILNAVKLDWVNIQNAATPDWSSYLSNLIGAQAGGSISGPLGWSARLDYSFDYTKSLFPDGPAFGAYLYLRK